MSLVGLDERTLEEAKASVARVRDALTKAGIENVYRVGSMGSSGWGCLESCPPQYYSEGVYVNVDVPPSPSSPSDSVAVGKVELPLCGGDDVEFLMLACGLLDRLLVSWRKRINYWQWDEPKQWQREREAYRKAQVAMVNAAKVDTDRKGLMYYGSLKRRYAKMASSVLGRKIEEDDVEGLLDAVEEEERPTKKQRTDAEVLEHRKTRWRVALPDNDNDDI